MKPLSERKQSIIERKQNIIEKKLRFGRPSSALCGEPEKRVKKANKSTLFERSEFCRFIDLFVVFQGTSRTKP